VFVITKKTWKYIKLLVIILLLVVIFFAVNSFTGFFSSMFGLFSVTPGEVIITQISKEAKLITTEVEIDTDIDMWFLFLKTTIRFSCKALYTDDLSTLSAEDIVEDAENKIITVYASKPELSHIYIDERTRLSIGELATASQRKKAEEIAIEEITNMLNTDEDLIITYETNAKEVIKELIEKILTQGAFSDYEVVVEFKG
jgi:hypothetical protein